MNDIKNITNLLGIAPAGPRTRPAGELIETKEPRRATRSPGTARLNFIPAADELKDLVERALSALAKGVYWDRGSIINILL